MPSNLILSLICIGLLVAEFIWIIAVGIRGYKRKVAEIDSYTDTIKFQPTKLRFAFSAIVYQIFMSVVILLGLCIFPYFRDRLIYFWGLIPLLLMSAIFSHPHYIILIREDKLNGPTLWGWQQRRLDLNLEWLDREKVLKQNPGRKLGIVIFYTHGGDKILSLGLNDSQINQILALASEASAVK